MFGQPSAAVSESMFPTFSVIQARVKLEAEDGNDAHTSLEADGELKTDETKPSVRLDMRRGPF